MVRLILGGRINVLYHQETVPHLNFHVPELGEVVAYVCCGSTLSHVLLELHRTLVSDEVSLPLLVSFLWIRSKAAFAPLFQAVVPSFCCLYFGQGTSSDSLWSSSGTWRHPLVDSSWLEQAVDNR